MERVQAINLIKELSSIVPNLTPEIMSISETETNGQSSTECTVQFKGLPNDTIEQITRILDTKKIAFQEKDNTLFIYLAKTE